MNKPKEILISSSKLKIREPEVILNAPVAILLHGWTGDESSMWVFGNKLENKWLIIAPRAPFPTIDQDLGGYSWVDQSIKQWPTHQDFFPAVDYLSNQINTLTEKYPYANFSKINLIGFSQGAAMGFVFAGAKTLSIKKLVLLSGFLPEGHEGYVNPDQFRSVELFIGHGRLDEVVPVSKANEVKTRFDGSCETLVYCVSEVGHRLGSDCFNAFKKFMND